MVTLLKVTESLSSDGPKNKWLKEDDLEIRVSLNNESRKSPPATLTTGSIRGKNKLCKRFLDLVNV